MGVYEEKQGKEREALEAQFRASSKPLAEKLIAEIEKASGIKPKESVQEGSHWISIWIDEPRISIEVQHDWGTGRHHYGSQPLGTAKIVLNLGRFGRGSKTWYRPNGEGAFNIEKIVKTVAEQVEGYKIGQKARQEGEVKDAENKAAKAKELDGIKLLDGAFVDRHNSPDSYTFRFGGTFSGLSAQDVAALSESFKKLTAQYKFEKSWRMDY